MDMDLKARLTQKKAKLTDNARVVLSKRYLKKDDNGNLIETPEDMFFRVAENIASIEKNEGDLWTEKFYDMMINMEFLPNSPTLMNAGRDLQQLSACFVLPVGDSMEEIFEAVKNSALIQKSGGGVGYSFSRLRPKNDLVKSTRGVSSGPISFMRVFDVTTDTIRQGGVRRGALMANLRCDHPDIMEFISIKEKDGVLSNFNISVAITDEFIGALKNNTDYPLRNPRDGVVVGSLKASDVFNKIVNYAWKNGEPGIIFIDRINEYNPTPLIGKIESTNPCVTGDTKILMDRGELEIQTLEGQCVNVWNGEEYSNVKIEKTGVDQDILRVGFSNNRHIDCTYYHKFYLADGEKVEAKDLNLKDSLEIYTLPDGSKQEVFVTALVLEKSSDVYCFNELKRHRGTFNGIVTGNCGEQPLLPEESCNLGSINVLQMLHKVKDEGFKIDYAKLEDIVKTAVRFLDNVIDLNKYPLPQIDKMTKSNRKIGLGVMGFADALIKMGISYNSEVARRVAEEVMGFITQKGLEESHDLAIERGVFPNFKGSIYDGGPKIRNATITTIAPTGTLSMIAGCSSGIEPIFSIVYEKNVLDGKKFLEIHPEFLKAAKERGFYSDEVMEAVKKSGSAYKIQEIPQEIRDIFITAHDIDPKEHIIIQAAFQAHTHNAVSKTINFPKSATVQDVEEAYMLAYDLGCKGVTVYRDGSRENQVLTSGIAGTSKIVSKDIKLPNIFNNGPTHVIKKEGKKFYIHFSYLPEDMKNEFPVVFWIHTNAKYKADELRICNKAARNLAKLALSSGIEKKYVTETVDKANSDYPHNRLGRMISICLRHNIPREDILISLEIEGDNYSTLLYAVRKFLSKTLPDGTKLKGLKCPECGKQLIMESGCKRCPSEVCGWSAC